MSRSGFPGFQRWDETYHPRLTSNPCRTSNGDSIAPKSIRSLAAVRNSSMKMRRSDRFWYRETVRTASSKNGFSSRNSCSVVFSGMMTKGKCGIMVRRKPSRRELA